MRILDGHAQAEIRFDPMLHHLVKQRIGKDEIIGSGIGLVCVKIAENIGNIHKQIAAKHAVGVVETGIWNIRLGQIMKHRGVNAILVTQGKRRLTNRVHRLDPAQFLFKIKLKLHFCFSPDTFFSMRVHFARWQRLAFPLISNTVPLYYFSIIKSIDNPRFFIIFGRIRLFFNSERRL